MDNVENVPVQTVDIDSLNSALDTLPAGAEIEVMAFIKDAPGLGKVKITDALPAAQAAFDKSVLNEAKVNQVVLEVGGYTTQIGNANSNANSAKQQVGQLATSVQGFAGAIGNANTTAQAAHDLASSFEDVIQQNVNDVQDAKTDSTEAKQRAETLTLLVAPSLKYVDNSENKVISFKQDKFIPQFEITQDTALEIDMTDAKVGCSTSFSVLQKNGAKMLLNNIKQSGYPLPDQNNVVNDYIVFLPAIGRPRFIRFVDSDDFPESGEIEIGETDITAEVLSDSAIKFDWTAATAATRYILSLFIVNDFTGVPVFTFQADADTFTKTFSGLAAITTYYYKLTPASESKNGTSVTGSATTQLGYAAPLTLDFAQPLVDDGESGYTPGNNEIGIYMPSGGTVKVADGKLGINGNANGDGNFYLYNKPNGNWAAGNYRVTVSGLSSYAGLKVGYTQNDPTSFLNEIAIYNIVIGAQSENILMLIHSSNGRIYIGSIKIEKQNQL